MLQIIPVIDIRGGIVVHARGGDREAYPPLQSVLTQSTRPETVVADLLAWYPFPQVYIADLEAIESGDRETTLYRSLCDRFKQTEIWLDAGIESARDVDIYPPVENLKLVVGSETLTDIELLANKACRERLILSLDRRHDRLLGDKDLLSRTDIWTQKMILMSLDHVGADKGPACAWLETLAKVRKDISWYVAGGVRGRKDLEIIEEKGATGALIASAIHTGKLSRQAIADLMQWEHRPSSEGR